LFIFFVARKISNFVHGFARCLFTSSGYFYLRYSSRLWLYFSKEGVFIWRQEYLRDEPVAASGEVFRFLGFEPYDGVKNRDVRSLPYDERILSEMSKFFRSVFESV
jgi:hypothetical protein